MGEPEYYPKENPPAVLPTREALIDFAINCGVRLVYVFDDRTWSCKEL
jgi:hypothetical protein